MVDVVTPALIVAVILGVIGSGTIGGLLGAGIARRFLEPLIAAGIAAHESLATTHEARKEMVRKVIDEQTARDDGVIRKHTREIDERGAAEVRQLREMLTTFVEEMAQFRGVLGAWMDQMPDRRTPVDAGRATAPPAPQPLGPPRRSDTNPGRPR